MEQINKIELLGKVGNVKISEFEDGGRVARASLVTNYVTLKNGQSTVEATWHNLVIRPGRTIRNEWLDMIQKGQTLHVLGRERNVKYSGADGVERQSNDVMVYQLEFIDDTANQIQPQMY